MPQVVGGDKAHHDEWSSQAYHCLVSIEEAFKRFYVGGGRLEGLPCEETCQSLEQIGCLIEDVEEDSEEDASDEEIKLCQEACACPTT